MVPCQTGSPGFHGETSMMRIAGRAVGTDEANRDAVALARDLER